MKKCFMRPECLNTNEQNEQNEKKRCEYSLKVRLRPQFNQIQLVPVICIMKIKTQIKMKILHNFRLQIL
jgi:hypothetical protein